MILATRYPDYETKKEIIVTCSIAGGLLYLLLIIYQPFGTSQFEHAHKYLMLFPYAIISAISFCSVSLLVKHKKWTLGLELLKIFLILLLISSLSYLYNALFLSKVDLSFENYLFMCLYTSALGLPVSAIYVMARYIYLTKKHPPALTTNIPVAGYPTKPENSDIKERNANLYIVADYGNIHFEIAQKDFIYAETADNYCIIHFYNHGIVQKEIIRISLTKLLKQIQTDAIKRIHRSFIVNLKMVTRYKGNTSGYKISLDNLEKNLMVSRNYLDSIIPFLKNFVIRP